MLAALLSLAGCGPGTGGTGTGHEQPDYLSLAGANPSAVCASGWAERLACQPPPPSSAADTRHPGTNKVVFASVGSVPAADYVVTFDANGVLLQGGCPRRSFEGDWGQLGNGAFAYFGAFSENKQVVPYNSSLLVRSTADGNGLMIEVHASSDGRLLLGPLLLQRVPAGGSGGTLRPC
ncbi:hypothetical protein G8A07_02995 [Roseateles sp. DAIF2]|uniref:hypothetical protein n=1 Tax=Roseateles sp. DAIF2 TaxID=2714952 RepID=UPI0018A3385F|nr:hypothetical protein [Roseateles sp. DAIF2]QPF71996.1 hypothetical protein G8A07_02995 [Roseateles sp. DAIF2]